MIEIQDTVCERVYSSAPFPSLRMSEYGYDHKSTVNKTYIDEKTISGLTQIERSDKWSSDEPWNYKHPKFSFTVYFSGNRKTFNYESLEIAQSWHNYILRLLS